MNTLKVTVLRAIHGLFARYFVVCLVYLYYAAIMERFDVWLAIAFVSLGLEGLVVFVLNKGDCPLVHIQRKVGDDKPFFELIFPPKLAKQAIPMFAILTWLAVALLVLRFDLVAAHS